MSPLAQLPTPDAERGRPAATGAAPATMASAIPRATDEVVSRTACLMGQLREGVPWTLGGGTSA